MVGKSWWSSRVNRRQGRKGNKANCPCNAEPLGIKGNDPESIDSIYRWDKDDVGINISLVTDAFCYDRAGSSRAGKNIKIELGFAELGPTDLDTDIFAGRGGGTKPGNG